MLSVSRDTDAPTLIDPADLSSLVDAFAVVFIRVPHQQLDDCSECPEATPAGPGKSVLLITYKRYGRIYREPVCGLFCASQKVRALLASIAKPDFIHVHVIERAPEVAA